MSSLLVTVDQFLRREGAFAEDAPAIVERRTLWRQVVMIVLCGAVYGAVMGSYKGLAGDGWQQMLLSAAKVPVLFFVTFLLCLPSFYVLNAVAGLHEDFPRVLHALLAFQSLTSIVLAAVAPITWLMNVSTADYGFIVMWSGMLFAVASIIGHARMRREYAPLIARNQRHRLMRFGWTVLYMFVGIQMAWVLRPFVGDPHKPFQLFRAEAWGNAYIQVIQLVGRELSR